MIVLFFCSTRTKEKVKSQTFIYNIKNHQLYHRNQNEAQLLGKKPTRRASKKNSPIDLINFLLV